MEPGLYVTFFSAGEPFAEELPPVGPLEHLVVRDRSIVADRKDVHQSDHFGSGGRWLEAELELQRAIGRERGGARRPDLRIGAPQGVYLRFVSFDEAAEPDPVPELGPYAVIVVGRRGVEADGKLLATRSGPKQTLWELTPTGELYSELWAQTPIHERGAWMVRYGFTVYASKAEVTVKQGTITATLPL